VLGAELLDQREDIAPVFREQCAQMLRRRRARVLLHDPCGTKLFVCLLIEILSICDDDESPVPRHRPQHLLREEHHRNGLA
jgi:hypothetical protein